MRLIYLSMMLFFWDSLPGGIPIPMPVAAFVESHDLENKKIIPFVTHGTSGIAGTIRDLKKLLPSSATIEKEIGIYRSEIRNGKNCC